MGNSETCSIKGIENIKNKNYILGPDEEARIQQKFGSRKSYLTPKDINSVWENYLSRNLNRQLLQLLFPNDKRRVTWECFVDLYLNFVEESQEVQAISIMTLIAYDNNDASIFKLNQMPLVSLYGYFKDIIASYIKILRYQKNSELNGWLSSGVSFSPYECYNVGKHISYYLETYQGKVGLGSLEAWLYRCGIFKNISAIVFRTIYNLIKVEDQESLVPDINCSKEIRTVLDLCHVIILNTIIPSSLMSIWRLLYANCHFEDSWRCMVSSILSQGPTLLIVEDTNSNLFGAFAGTSWYPFSDFYGSELTFIFTLRPDVNVYYPTGYNRNYQYMNIEERMKPIGLGIGGRLYTFGLFLNGIDWGMGHVSESCTTFKMYSPPCQFSAFRIKRLEIWGLGPAEYTKQIIEEKLIKELNLGKTASSDLVSGRISIT